MNRIKSIVVAPLLALGVLALAGCGTAAGPLDFNQAKPLDFNSYEQIYAAKTYSCIWYTGSDQNFHYYSMEHWSYNQDKSDGHLESRELYKVPVDQINVPSTFPLTTDQDKWVLVWPTKIDQVQ